MAPDSKQYRCENDRCRFKYNEPFAEGTERALAFKKASGFSDDKALDDLLYCVCGRMLMVVKERVPTPPSDVPVFGVEYGGLLLCCDLSASMKRKSPGERGTNLDKVVNAMVAVLRDFAAVGEGASDEGRPRHYHRMLIAVVRYAKDCSVFRLQQPGGPPEGVAWFTPRMLAEAEGWGTDEGGMLKADDIERTLRDKVLPIPRKDGLPKACVDGSRTNLEGALRAARDLALQLTTVRPGAADLPKNYGLLGDLPGFERRKQFWAVVYSDGEVNEPDATGESARQAAQELDKSVPELHRLTAFFGTERDEKQQAGGKLLEEIASPCYADHAAASPAYFGRHEAPYLRLIIHMATADVDTGICPECLKKMMNQ